MPSKRPASSEKTTLHPRNRNRSRYDFKKLKAAVPELEPFVLANDFGVVSIDFFNPEAVRLLNKALLKTDYGVEYWEIPPDYLCPPVPGRADYIHNTADLLASVNNGKIPTGKKIHVLDIGVGANCIYPIIGVHEYGWSFVGTDIDTVALRAAQQIVMGNSTLKDQVELRHQEDPEGIVDGIIAEDELFDLVICNPPFHTSLVEAKEGNVRKVNNLSKGKLKSGGLNFGGQYNELWCKGGEARFIRFMIIQSTYFSKCCFWFSTIVSKKEHLRDIYEELEHRKAVEVKTIPMKQGSKAARIVAWTFLTPAEQQQWAKDRWNTTAAE
jgi:23S rRNA (adenine1618-N6)-methyltransferase